MSKKKQEEEAAAALLKKKKEEEEKARLILSNSNDTCCICLDGKKSVVLLPCRHLCLCEKCNSPSLKKCPICRSTIESRMVVF